MELKLKITYTQLIQAIKELPPKDFLRLKEDLFTSTPKPERNGKSLYERLLEGPVMSDKQHEEFLENRKKLNEWRTR